MRWGEGRNQEEKGNRAQEVDCQDSRRQGIWKTFATLHNIWQQKKHKGRREKLL